ncbi:cytochrome c biogenesis protein ResB [Paenibacillus albiflavus]|uniref:Cytochrome c biogenesis protein ResB n=1 Tax=Paenibacillus albiflavus TaxID=2545760 RepID=A0A4R4EP51_9BACL|nr:cytochrome c biogenesis protein ResB [Paenibacillus albiflavus]TCZ81250.1 cytochrome c biogenesis protein ResB [Paenibacillus albiflavus]
MIENTKCECGHQNPVGTVLCEYCGKPLEGDENDTTLLEMRYDGIARRSQKQNPNLIDKVWRFFSSVKIAVYIIIVTLLGASLGTILPQESLLNNIDPADYYKDTYGTFGEIYHTLGLSHTFNSWWFMTLLFMIGVSLVICSLDRVLPLYKALTRQNIRKHHSFLHRQKVSYSGMVPNSMTDEEWTDAISKALKKKHYRVHQDGTAILAEKNRFSRWGPYVLHIGLILFLLGALARSIPGWHMDQYVDVMEGATVRIPNTNYYIKNVDFTLDLYSDEELTEKQRAEGKMTPKQFETQAVLYECTSGCDEPGVMPVLKEVASHDIRVNDALNYHGLMAYQYSYRPTLQLVNVKPKLIDKATGEIIGSFELPMLNPPEEIKVGDYTIYLRDYYPDFGLSPQGTPITLSNKPNAPAFIFLIKGPNLKPDGEIYLYFPKEIDKVKYRQDDINGAMSSKIELKVGTMADVQIAEYTSTLNIRVDKAMPIIWAGAAIGMIGLVMGFYWQHRRVWLRVDDRQIVLGAYTNKNWFGFRKEVADSLNQSMNHLEPIITAKLLDRGVGKS